MTFSKLRRHCTVLFVILFCFLLQAPFVAAAVAPPSTQAAAVYFGDPVTGRPLYEKNAEERRYPASTTKIMTSLLVLENVQDLDQRVKVLQEDFEGVEFDSSKAGFVVGEEVPVIDLLYGLMLPSGNEAANTLARFVSGSVPAFVEKMNARAAELGCTNTHFENPNGLHDDNHYTTAHDLFRITQEAMKNETFALIVNTAQKNLSDTNKNAEHPGGKNLKVYTTNQLILSSSSPLYYGYAKGVKTGNTSQAGYCLVSAAKKKKTMLYMVILGSDKASNAAYKDTKAFYNWAFDNFSTRTLVEEGQEITEAPVRLSTDTDKLMLVAGSNIDALVANDLSLEDFEQTITLPDDVKAPIEKGQKIGSLTLTRDGINYGTVDLLSLSDVSLSEVLYYADVLRNFFSSGLFKVIFVALLLLLGVYVSAYVIRIRRKRMKRQQMMRSKYARMEQYERDQQHKDPNHRKNHRRDQE